MYQQIKKISPTILLITLNLSSICNAIPNQLKKDYEQFQTEIDQALQTPQNKKKFLTDFKKTEQNLQLKYQKFSKQEGQELSPEGNQMALDLEMLEPLKILSTNNISSTSCNDAHLVNELNNESDPKTYQKIKTQIQELCKIHLKK